MAYTIPVAALLLDEKAAAAAINKPPDYFEDSRNDRWQGIQMLQQLTGAPVESFTDENQDIYYLGLRIEENWRIDIDTVLLNKAIALRAQYPHHLVSAARLAVVSEFC
jgi:hypothetical protein